MANTFNFNTIKKKFLTVTLPDEKKTMILVGLPTKAIFDEFVNLKNSLGEVGDDAIEELYSIVAKILNCNKNGVKISTETVKEIMDFEDIVYFIQAYAEFIQEITNSKN